MAGSCKWQNGGTAMKETTKNRVIELMQEVIELQQDIISDMHNTRGGQAMRQAMTLQRDKTRDALNAILHEGK
jgi:hypothetical protein